MSDHIMHFGETNIELLLLAIMILLVQPTLQYHIQEPHNSTVALYAYIAIANYSCSNFLFKPRRRSAHKPQ